MALQRLPPTLPDLMVGERFDLADWAFGDGGALTPPNAQSSRVRRTSVVKEDDADAIEASWLERADERREKCGECE